MKGDVTTDTKEIQRIIRKYHEELYANRMDNLEETVKFLDIQSSKTEPGRTENLNREITTSEFEAAVKKSPLNRSPVLDGFSGKFYQTLKRRTNTYLFKLLQKNSRREDPQAHFVRPALS